MNSESRNWKDAPYLLISLLAVLISLVYASWDSLVEMERMWGSKEEYGYAYIIPFITAYFVWQRRYDVLQHEFHLSWVGGVWTLFGLFLLLLGIQSATFSITQYGFLISLISVIWLLLGFPAFKVIAGPLLLLLLIVPLPSFLYNNLSGKLQLISSEIGVWVIRQFDISVHLEGNVIDLGVYKLQVVEACSGLRYLFPLFSLALIAAFIYRAAMWKRIVLVLSSIPITVLMNSFRIGMIGVLVEYGGIEQAEGFLHDFEGWIIFMASTAILVVVMWVLLKIGQDKRSLLDAFFIESPSRPESPYKYNRGTVGKKHVAVAVVISCLAIVVGSVNYKDEVIPERDKFSSFNLDLTGWREQQNTLEPQVLDALKLDDYFIADYVNNLGENINFYMAYYKSQKSGEAAHSPRSCIPGGGWKIKDLRTINVEDVMMSGQPLYVNRLLIQKGDYSQLVYYWFQQRNRIITNEYLVKWYLFWDSMTKSRTDGALVRLTIVVKPGDDLNIADKQLTEFARNIEPLMDRYIPR